MRVAIDVTSTLVEPTGVGTFVNELVRALVRQPDVQLNAYAVSARNGKKLRDQLPHHITVAMRPMAAKPLFAMWKRASFPRIESWTGAVNVVHGTNVVTPPAKAARVMTVHDLSPVRYPELCDGVSLSFPAHIRRAVARGVLIHVPSAYIASELRAEFGAAPEQVQVIPHGVPHLPTTQAEDDRWAQEATGGAPYLLAVGTVEPRKDFPLLVRAFAQLRSEFADLRLVIAGADAWGSGVLDQTILESGVADRVQRIGYVSNRLRAALFSHATAFVYPSLYEGFGFPPLEAMSAGLPVVATRAGAVPEVVGNAAVLVDSGDVDAMSEAIASTLNDENLRKSLYANAQAQLNHYDWNKTAASMVELYRRALEPDAINA